MKPGRKKAATEKNRDRPALIAGVFVIALITLLLYAPARNFDILFWDDNVYLYDNPVIKDLSPEGIATVFTTFYASNYHPLTTFSWMLEYAAAGFNPKIFHLTNVILHLLNVLLVLFISRRILKNTYAAFTAALIFSVHPLHVESVAWISERKDLLYTFFLLLSLNAYLNHLEHKKLKFYLYCLFFFLCSLFSKSAAVVLPVLLFLIDYITGRKPNRSMITDKIPLVILSALFSIITILSQEAPTQESFAPHFPLWQRPFIAAYATLYYLTSFFLPTGMSPLHPYPSLPGGTIRPYLIAFIILLAIITALLILWRLQGRHKPVLLFGLLFFMISLLPVLQLVPVGQAIVADRYTYLPYFGLALVTGWAVFILPDHFKTRKPLYPVLTRIILAGMILFFIIQTVRYQENWRSSSALFSAIVQRYPGHQWSWYNLGRTKMEYRDYDGAIQNLSRALSIDPKNTTIRYLRSQAYMQTRNFSSVIRDLDTLLNIDPSVAKAYINRGTAKGMIKDYSGSVIDFTHALTIKPGDTGLLVNRGMSYWYAGDHPNACRDWDNARILGSRMGAALLTRNCPE